MAQVITSAQCKSAKHGTTERVWGDAPGTEHIFEAHSCPGVTFNWDTCEPAPCACSCHA